MIEVLGRVAAKQQEVGGRAGLDTAQALDAEPFAGIARRQLPERSAKDDIVAALVEQFQGSILRLTREQLDAAGAARDRRAFIAGHRRDGRQSRSEPAGRARQAA
jgi:hypothetical protein